MRAGTVPDPCDFSFDERRFSERAQLERALRLALGEYVLRGRPGDRTASP
jgi:hypothetical protein